MARRQERDWDIEKYTLATLRLIKYLQTPSLSFVSEADGMEYVVDKVELFNRLISRSSSKQFIFGKKSKLANKNPNSGYKVYKDLSIEVPVDFDTQILDKFIYQIGF